MVDQDNSPAGEDGTSARQRAIEAYDGARERAVDTLGEAPLIALGAGAVIGALFAAMLPTSLRERKLLRPYGKRVTDAGREAAEAARQAGTDKLRELGLTPDVLADKAGEAAKATAQAAIGTFKDEAKS
jgi:hypothetical protein